MPDTIQASLALLRQKNMEQARLTASFFLKQTSPLTYLFVTENVFG